MENVRLGNKGSLPLLHVVSDSLIFHFNNGEYLLKNQLFFDKG